ncbi:hypothetical protein DPMN_161238 [Dreissena polymorpha]|uniref:Uncharacterized protein n=1 Tax=Dreissena polymorpha TaxID=45954 RepID=A0A9D4IT98_DREPO|nr:hypothetical protein DPMN_161238 [Dreissena polymorpha]
MGGGQRPIPKPHLSNQANNVTSRTIFKLTADINKFKLFTKFYDDWAKHVTSRVKMQPPDNHETNVRTKFHENWAKNVTSRVFTCCHDIHIEKTAPPTGGHVFSSIWTIFELVPDINKTNLLTKFHNDWANNEINVLTKWHEHWTKNVISRVFTCFRYIHIATTAPPLGGHVFSPIWTIFQLVRDINNTHVLTKFNDDWANIMTSRVFTGKTDPPTGGHVFQRTGTTFELNQHIIKTNTLTNYELNRDIIWTNLLIKFRENRTRNVPSRVFTRKSAKPTGFIGTNLLTKFHEDRTRNVAFRVFTRKTYPPNGGHHDPLQKKFHENRTRNVASIVFTNKCGRTDRRRTKTDHKSSNEQSGELKQ